MARRLLRLFLLTSYVFFAISVLLLLKRSRQQWVPLRGQLVSSTREDYFYVTAGDDEPAVAASRNVKPQPLRNSIRNFRSTKLAVPFSIQNGVQLNNKTITVTNNPKKLATNSSKRFLVYYCPQNVQCSGWGDQQRAFVDVFLLACIAKRHFRIILQSPCDVRNFYVPNKYNWIADEREFQGRTRRNIRNSDLLGKLKTMADFNAVFPEDVIYVTTNGGFFTEIMANPNFKASMPTWAETFLAHHFHNAWDILMKPSARLQQRLEAFLHSVGFYNRTHPLVGVHVRVGKNPSNPNEVIHINDVNKTGPLWEFLDHYVRNGSQIFLASDSAEVRNISRSRFGTAHHDTDGVILHVSKQHRHPRACQGYEDALLDQLILTKCDVLVKSKSGFSLRAGYIRGRADNLFFYRQGLITKVQS